ncbi:MAG: helix-turn-helix domain-containing protein [Prevotella sp.]|nr:helix-turn-helix domain-containing protein [Prevotella sp.]MBP3844539.1 helix-turn-helix domain-containing protein [Prevotella sp.]
MEKIDDLELSELQELALRSQTVLPRKSLEEKCMIVKAHLSNHVPITQLSKEFGIPRVTIWRWIRTFADGRVPKGSSKGTADVKPNPPAMPKKKQNVEESAADELARLREENKRLSEALRMSEWMNHAKDVMIDEAEKTFNIPIRKKSGAKQ